MESRHAISGMIRQANQRQHQLHGRESVSGFPPSSLAAVPRLYRRNQPPHCLVRAYENADRMGGTSAGNRRYLIGSEVHAFSGRSASIGRGRFQYYQAG